MDQARLVDRRQGVGNVEGDVRRFGALQGAETCQVVGQTVALRMTPNQVQAPLSQADMFEGDQRSLGHGGHCAL